ncbi:MAG TPA: type VI secretion system baseplate subunit TssG [Candidatus Sulfotelmatobacter sp.]
MTETFAHMPSLESGFFGFHHTVDSALQVLAALDVSPERISLRMAGRGYPSRWIVAQEPSPGTELAPGVRITLSVAGLGYFHALPVAMWDSGGENELGTQEIVGLLDDPLQKAGHWVREGARLFDLQADHFEDCSRWISLFGLNPDDWPPEIWYDLAILLPSMRQLVATEPGIRLVFQLLLHLPVQEIRFFPAYRSLPDSDCSLLGARLNRLGVDCIVGNEVEDLAGVWLQVGPISLASYYDYQQSERKRLVTSVLNLCTTCQRKCWVSWLVADPEKAPRLGFEVENARLGINSHLGRPELVEA